ncbi:response regulator transcription factor [Ramlibacter sp. MMS24-I3-19]|uniref:response regulator transcription factor n=1 Tax=Ramlibacter sp. MMS24-I3-19 TaxID=3416606 RepID=UPI003D027C51
MHDPDKGRHGAASSLMATVLLVDDDPHQRAFAALVLAEAGHSVREAGDGAEGLQLALDDPPQLIVCDVVMPRMNGYQMVAAVRAEPSICTTPVILLTSLAGRAQVRAGMTAGADDYLAKPFQPAELRDAVQALLQRRQAQFDAIAGSVMQDMDAALEEQREALGARYESQLLAEVNRKWKTDVAAGAELVFPRAALVMADLYRAVEREEGGPVPPGELLRRAHLAASDALYLFGAVHVLAHGGDLVAVFGTQDGLPPNLPQLVRAAFALQAAAGAVLGADTGPDSGRLTVAIEAGPVSLLRLHDPLHGDAGLAAVPGSTLRRALALRRVARAQGWAVAAPAPLAERVPPAVATFGRLGKVPNATGAVELLRARG